MYPLHLGDMACQDSGCMYKWSHVYISLLEKLDIDTFEEKRRRIKELGDAKLTKFQQYVLYFLRSIPS